MPLFNRLRVIFSYLLVTLNILFFGKKPHCPPYWNIVRLQNTTFITSLKVTNTLNRFVFINAGTFLTVPPFRSFLFTLTESFSKGCEGFVCEYQTFSVDVLL